VTSHVVTEMDRRRELFAGVFARNLLAYNERVPKVGAPPLPLILVVIDEVSDIALQAGLKSTFYRNLIRLSSKGAAFGIILVLATQNPKAEVLNTLIRGNMSTRIAFRVSSVEHSRTILGCGGAQTLSRTIRGRMKARLDDALVELQGFHVPDEAVLSLTRHWIASSGPTLSPVERALVVYARQELDGAFPIRRLYDQFKGQISYRQLVRLGRRWENNGWLEPSASAVEARIVNDALWNIAIRSSEPDACSREEPC
jgi:DNA segregation ATPase FtsK/SpoIIIE-like protein